MSEDRVMGIINELERGRTKHEDGDSSVMRSSTTILLGWSNQTTRNRLGS
jgi:hypothetical protein